MKPYILVFVYNGAREWFSMVSGVDAVIASTRINRNKADKLGPISKSALDNAIIALLTVLYLASLYELYISSLQLKIGLSILYNPHEVWVREALPWTIMSVCACLLSHYCARLKSPLRQASILIGVSLLSSLWLTIEPLSYSMDILRYLWDGRLLIHGLSPYDFVPDDPRILSLRNWPYWSMLAWKDWPEAYPPLAQLYFGAIAWCSHQTIGAYKWFMFANGWIANILFLLVLSAKKKLGFTTPMKKGTRLQTKDFQAKDVKALGLFLLFPPLLLESYGSGHVDALALPFVLWAFLAGIRRRPYQLGFAIAMATSIKLFPVVLFAAFWKWKRGEMGYVVRSWLGFAGGISLVLLPFARHAAHLTKFFGHVSQMDYNGSLELVLRQVFGQVIDNHSTWLIAAAVLLSWALVTCSPVKDLRIEQKVSLLGLTFFLASPVVHPWYLIVLIPFAVIGRDLAVLWLAVASHYTYDEVPLDMYIEYVPTYGLYLYQWIAGWRAARHCIEDRKVGGDN